MATRFMVEFLGKYGWELCPEEPDYATREDAEAAIAEIRTIPERENGTYRVEEYQYPETNCR